MGELSPVKSSEQFMNYIFHEGAHYKADGFAVHPYQYCTPPDNHSKNYVKGTQCTWPSGFGYGIAWSPTWQDRLKHLHEKGRLSAPKGGAVPLYLTEFGYHRDGKAALPETARSKWYPRAMSEAKKSGAKAMNIYQIYAGNGTPGVWDTGLIAPGDVPLASFTALQNWSKANGYPVRN
jgi:hypothetical protein